MFKKPKTPIPKQEVQSIVYSTIKTTVIYTLAFFAFGIAVGFLVDLFK